MHDETIIPSNRVAIGRPRHIYHEHIYDSLKGQNWSKKNRI